MGLLEARGSKSLPSWREETSGRASYWRLLGRVCLHSSMMKTTGSQHNTVPRFGLEMRVLCRECVSSVPAIG